VDAATSLITTVAGTGSAGFTGDGGPAAVAQLFHPRSVALDGAGNLFITDAFNRRVRRVDAGTGVITTVAGSGGVGYEGGGFSGDGGSATEALLSWTTGVALDGAGNLFVGDELNYRVRRVAAVTGVITTVAGTGEQGFSGDGGLATAAQLGGVYGVALDGAGNLFIADRWNGRVRRVDAVSGLITTVAGTGGGGPGGDGGPATASPLGLAYAVALDGAGNLFIGNSSQHSVRVVWGIAEPVMIWPGIGPGE